MSADRFWIVLVDVHPDSPDNEGWLLRFGYAPVRNWALNATYFLNKRNVDVAQNAFNTTEVDYDRL